MPTCSAGFTLLELSIVLVIIALISGMSMSMGSSMIESARRASTNNKLDEIEKALLAFRMVSNRLPCPADVTIVKGAANFGVEAANPGTCTGGAPAANYTYNIPFTNTNGRGGIVVEGVVPTKALGLPDEFMVDGWGRRIGYSVWAPATGINAYVIYGVTPSCGAIAMNNANGAARTGTADYTLISYGPDGHGGYLSNGTRMSAGSTNTDELTNCHCTSNLVGNPAYTATYVQKDPTQNPASSTDTFDDLVRYKERWQLQNTNDIYSPNGASCAPGFRVDGATAWDSSGWSVAVGDVNGDGIPDLIIGANNGSTGMGFIYVVFGTRNGFPDPLPLSSLNATNGFRLDGVTANDSSGFSVATGVGGDEPAVERYRRRGADDTPKCT